MDMAILIDTPGLAVTHGSRLLKGEAAARVIAASALMNEVQEAADALRQEAQQAAASVRKQAQQAFEQEKKRGWQEGWRTGRTEAQAAMASALAEAAAARQVGLHTLAPELVELVLEAATKVIQGVDRRHLFARAVESVDGLLHQARWARLRVAPRHLDEARLALDEAGQGVVSLVNLVADPTLGEDDAVFESDRGVCNASLSVQLAALEGALRRAVSVLQPAASLPASPAADTAQARSPE
ncbi:MAG: FliH/SctL family protein [Pseudomonadota bacterium]